MSRKLFSLATRMCSGAGVAGVFLGLSITASGQAVSQAIPRISGPVNASALTTLKGTTISVANALNDRGRVPDNQPTGRLLLMLKHSPDQQKALALLIQSQQNPKSPNFHKWLTTAQYAQQFGVADADIQTVNSYLSDRGFTVAQVLPNKMAIEFSGTMGQLRSTFKTEIHSFTAKGQTFFANDRDPQIPTALSPVISGFASLTNYRPRATTSALSAQPINKKITGKVHADYTDINAGAVNVGPGDLRVLYDIPATANGNTVTIGVVGDSDVNLTYVNNYRTTFGLGAKTPAVIVDGEDPGTTDTNALNTVQLELLSAVAPSATINYYTSASTDLGTGLNYAFIRAVDDNRVQVLVLSQENCEANLGADFNGFINAVGEQAVALGISMIAPAGDGGSAECDSLRGYGNSFESAATKGLAVNGYASSPFVTAVGATDFYYTAAQQDPTAFTAFWNPTNGGTDGYTSAKGYITEQPWNDSNTATDAFTSFPALLASGGGVSTLGNVDENNNVGPYAQPAYQLGVVPAALSTTARTVPDVSIFGGDGQNASAYMVCLQADECVNGTPATLVYEVGGGTATSAATFGGVAALIVQAHGAQGNLNPALYNTYKTAPAAFHDVTIGTNTVACAPGSQDCGGDGFIAANGGQGYTAAAGYDAASGLGSVDVAKLLTAWAPPNTVSTSTSFTLTTPGTTTPLTSFVHGTPVQANITVTGSGGTPTGDVGIIRETVLPSNQGVTYETLTNGTVVDSYGLSGMSGGYHNVYARYAGDQTYAASISAPVTVNITPETSKIDPNQEILSFAPGSASPYGTPLTISETVISALNKNDIGTPTGSISVSDNGKALTILPLDGQGTVTLKANFAAGAHSLTFSYGGDASYLASTRAGAITFSIDPAATTSTLTATSNVDARGSAINLVAVVSSAATGGADITAPTGTFNFNTVAFGSTPATNLGSATIVPTTDTSGHLLGVATLQLAGNKLPAAADSVYATYTPAANSNYAPSLSGSINLSRPAGGLIATTTTLVTSDGKASYFDYTGQISFNLAVTPVGAAPGKVTLLDNGAPLSTLTLTTANGTGTATYTVNQDPNSGLLPAPFVIGRNVITAQYAGDATHLASTKTLTIVVLDEGSLPDFTMLSSTAYGVVTASSSAPITLQLASINNFVGIGGKVTFTTTAPAGLTCTYATNPLTFSSNYATDTATCKLAAGYTIASLEPAPSFGNRFWLATGGATMAFVFLVGIPARRRHFRGMLGLGLAVMMVLGMGAGMTMVLTGCGSNTASAAGLNGAAVTSDAAKLIPNAGGKTLAKGTYQVLLTGTAAFAANVQANTASTQTHNVAIQIVVN